MKTYRRHEVIVTVTPMRALDFLLKHPDATIDRPKRSDLYHGTDVGRQSDFRPGFQLTENSSGRVFWVEKVEFQRDYVEIDDNE